MNCSWLKRFPLVLLAGVMACTSKTTRQPTYTPDQMQEMNRLAVKKEALQIQQFVDRQGWPTIKTGSGLHYYIYERGSGDSAKPEMTATVRMVVTLLNGDTAYSYERYGDEKFVIERATNESGLHEAIQKMRVGDKAKIVLPSHLAFGVSGDMNRIPPRHSVVYDLQLIKVE